MINLALRRQKYIPVDIYSGVFKHISHLY